MISKKKKLLFICFSALIMVGLCIGVFADYNSDRVGTVVSSTPFDIGQVAIDFDTDSGAYFNEGYYILHLSYSGGYESNLGVCVYNNSYSFVLCNESNSIVRYNLPDLSTSYYGDLGSYYIYIYVPEGSYLSKSNNYDSNYISIEIYSINQFNSIDIYDNSQDVWASVASIVDDATDSVINNNILLMFAAAIPILSFGVGMLIRLFHKS